MKTSSTLLALVLCFFCGILAADQAGNKNFLGSVLILVGLGKVLIVEFGLAPEENEIRIKY